MLDVPISQIFEGLASIVRLKMWENINMDKFNGIALDDQEVGKVVRSYYRIADTKLS